MLLNMLRLLICLNLYLFSINLYSSEWYQNQRFSLGIGSLSEFIGNVQIDDNGSRNGLEFNPLFSLGAQAKTLYELSIYPEFIWVIPRSIDSNKVTEYMFFFRSDFSHDELSFFNDKLKIKFGTSLIFNMIRGEGGEIILSNAGQSQAFYLPAENRTSINNTFDLSLDYQINHQLAVRLQTIHYQLFNAERRALSTIIQLTYLIDHKEVFGP
jgi:hypothetical protein